MSVTAPKNFFASVAFHSFTKRLQKVSTLHWPSIGLAVVTGGLGGIYGSLHRQDLSAKWKECVAQVRKSVYSGLWMTHPFLKFLRRPLLPIHTAECCGIVGYLGRDDAVNYLLDGINILQNRGYDSCGITTLNDQHQLVTTKFSSRGSTSDCIEILRNEAPTFHRGHPVGIGHTRWATHGAKTDANAHPHHDYKNRISVVHNGTIDNFFALKKRLLLKGIPFQSETDTEVIANLIGEYMDSSNSIEAAVASAMKELEGTWGMCILPADQDHRIIVARNGSPILVGSSHCGTVFISSEPAALVQFTNEYIPLDDGEIAVLTCKGIHHLFQNRQCIPSQIMDVPSSPYPFEHWTIKEIFEQPESLTRALNYGGRLLYAQARVKLGGLDGNEERLKALKSMILCGCGTSFHAALFGDYLFQWMGIFDFTKAIDASELQSFLLPKSHCGLILLSQSGETLDTIRASHIATSLGMMQLSVVNCVGSLLSRLANCGVYLNAGREVAVASTKSFSSQVCVLALIALWFVQHQIDKANTKRCEVMLDALQRMPLMSSKVLELRLECQTIAKAILRNCHSLFVLGCGFGYPIALEGALKIKEISYIHAEGFSGGSLKHGPFALIDASLKTPVILLILGDETDNVMKNAAQQVKSRGACSICITTDLATLEGIDVDHTLSIPNNGPLTPVLCNIVLQLLAYEVAIARGINPDKPRGLAKTVTVF